MQNKKLKIKEIIIVEGKYDKNTVSQVVDTLIVETSGYRIFSNKERMNLIRALAKARGIIILTDSDSAGFIIRNHIKGSVPTELIKHAYIPDVYGKERRKTTPSKEGKLGVEGMSPEVILEALRRSGATFIEDKHDDKHDASRGETHAGRARNENNQNMIEMKDFYAAGLTGRAGSSSKRMSLLRSLDLPEKISTKALLDVVNVLFTKSSFDDYLLDVFGAID